MAISCGYQMFLTMAKRQSKNKWINKALETMELVWNSDEFSCDSVAGIQEFINYMKMQRQENLDTIEACKNNVELAEGNIANAQAVLDQAEIEEFKAMNPKAKDVFKLR